tara:strand:+ start:82 stop:366 length:285 start_codon:yes stop_codon:yes gene_type:complete
MSYIELDSVGSLVTKDGLVFPIDCSEAPETASDAEEMMGVNILDVDDEWFYNLSCVDGFVLIAFLQATDLVLPNGFTDKIEDLMGSYDVLSEVA